MHAPRLLKRLVTTSLAAALAGGALILPPGAATARLPVSVRPRTFAQEVTSYPVLDGSSRQIGSTRWRVIKSAGNCCENYLAATASGRLLNLGGTYLHFSDDQGQTWQTVYPPDPLVGGEGAVTVAPGGDIVAVGWDVYSGDRLLAYKFDAASGAWSYSHTPLHAPFFDRPWLAAVKGPFSVGPITVPYITILKGGWPTKETWYYSLDGLNYLTATSKVVEQLATTAKAEDWLQLHPDPEADWTQPISLSGVTPLAGGGAVAMNADLLTLWPTPFAVLQPPALRWSSFKFAGNPGRAGRMLSDSRGRLHMVSIGPGNRDIRSLIYGISSDGGRTWGETTITFPNGAVLDTFDFKVNAGLGIGVIAAHVRDPSSNADQDLVYKFDINDDRPALSRLYFVGRGGEAFGSNVADLGPRFDFASVVILPDGRIATSFGDADHEQPALAVEIDTEPAPASTPAPPPASSSPTPESVPTRSSESTPRSYPACAPNPIRSRRTATEGAISPASTSPPTSLPHCE